MTGRMGRFVAGVVLTGFSLTQSLVEAADPHRLAGERTPEEAALLAPVEHDPSFQVIRCFRGNEKSQFPQEKSELASAMQESNRMKRALYDAASSGHGVVKVKQTCVTWEGSPVTKYFMVHEGTMTLVDDASRDPYGGGVGSYDVSELEIGYYDKDLEFHATPNPPEDKYLEIRYTFSVKGGSAIGDF